MRTASCRSRILCCLPTPGPHLQPFYSWFSCPFLLLFWGLHQLPSSRRLTPTLQKAEYMHTFPEELAEVIQQLASPSSWARTVDCSAPQTPTEGSAGLPPLALCPPRALQPLQQRCLPVRVCSHKALFTPQNTQLHAGGRGSWFCFRHGVLLFLFSFPFSRPPSSRASSSSCGSSSSSSSSSPQKSGWLNLSVILHFELTTLQ